MFVVYILYSIKLNKYYIGHTEDLEKRLSRHNSGKVKSTRSGMPWVVKHVEKFSNRNDGYRRELQIKSYKGGRAFKALIKDYLL